MSALFAAAVAWGQVGGTAPGNHFELADTVQLDRVDNTVLVQLERVKGLLVERQWDEAVEILRQLAETSDGKLLRVAGRRYVSLREWCQLQLAALPPDALKLCRARMDSVARQWYDQGIAERNRALLQTVVDQAFASRYGDDALMALGEMALESGDCAAARSYWERIVPSVVPPESRGTWPGYPDTNIDLAAVRARLVLVSILEGSTDRARAELAEFARLHPESRGRLGNQEGKYADILRRLLAESLFYPAAVSDSDWPFAWGATAGSSSSARNTVGQANRGTPHATSVGTGDWSTFAGNPQRNKIAPRLPDIGPVTWRIPLRPAVARVAGARPRGEDPREPPGFHPLLAGGLVFVNDDQRILALRCDTGKPAWGESAIYQSQLIGVTGTPIPSDMVGSPRFTMTVFQNRLFARMGSPVTGHPQESATVSRPGYIVCLDLKAEGKLLWKAEAEEGWALEGAPIADDRGVYVAMRRHDIRPQAFVACLDANTGRLRWRRFVCGAETPARGGFYETTHNLLTLSGDTLYYNTNLGAVAALRTDDGRPLWVSLYPRSRRGNLTQLAPHWRRDLNPCVVDRGTLLVAPADSPRIFAFDAATGQMLWQTGSAVEDASDLLGVAGDWLIAGGRKLYWISLKEADRGRVKHVWPDGPDRPGFGRGLLAGKSVLWSTRDKLYLFDQQTAEPHKVVDLTVHGAHGGNLVAADGRLLIANENELVAIGAYTERKVQSESISNFKSQISNCNSGLTHWTMPCQNTMTFKPYTN